MTVPHEGFKLRLLGCLLVAAWAAVPTGTASAQVPQFTYSGSYTLAEPSGPPISGSIRSSRNDVPSKLLSQNGASVDIRTEFAPVAFSSARAQSSNVPDITGSLADGVISLSYSVLFIPTDTASFNLASSWAQMGHSFGSVTGLYRVEAEGRADAFIRARSESGGFGVDAGQFTTEEVATCGARNAIAVANSNCGPGSFDLTLVLAALPGTTSFVGTVSLRAAANAGAGNLDLGTTFGRAYAFVDPLITLDPQLQGSLVLGGGAIANAVPEPAEGALMLAGLGVLIAALRRRRK